MTIDKVLDPLGAVARLHDGMTIGIGGWGPRRKPMALIREIVRSQLRDLTVVSYGGPDVGMLCAAGKVRKVIYGFVSLDAIPVEPFFRQAREAATIEARELDEGLLQWGLKAAAMRLPFLPTRVGLGTDVTTMNPEFRTVQSPYPDSEVLLAMPALRLDVALIHVDRADRLGNTITLGPDPYFDEHFARAADRCFVSCEELVDTIETPDPMLARLNQFERYYVSGVVHSPFGAHPTSNPPAYGWDMDHLKSYAGAASSNDGWARYCEEYLNCTEVAYIEKVGGPGRLRSLAPPVF